MGGSRSFDKRSIMDKSNAKVSSEPEVVVELTPAPAASEIATDTAAPLSPEPTDSASSTVVKPKPTFLQSINNKGDLSNIFTFTLMIVAIVLKTQLSYSLGIDYFLAFGLFGFAGGITNWLAVKMLFDIVYIGPFMLVGSGVIPRQFKGIREQVKITIMKTFFDEAYLEKYIRQRSRNLMESINIGQKITDMLSKPDVDQLLVEKFTEMSTKPEGMMLQTMAGMFGGVAGLVPAIKPMLVGFAKEMGEMFAQRFDPMEVMSVAKVRSELNSLMEEKLQLLTPEIVKNLMEEVIRSHLGWLIVW
jgi:hypothetical protein